MTEAEPAVVLAELVDIGKTCPPTTTLSGQLRTVWHQLRGQPQGAGGFQALSAVNLRVERGASLGLVGVNGAGKSTLLKVIARVVRPTTGRIAVNGRVGALLELGAGFHPEYTGRDNIALSCALMGLSPAETRRYQQAIIDFADIGDHIDQPVKHYSSGMVVRLGFAVATAVRPDLLITDEVLSVGDESFQRKCIAWMEDYLGQGGTLLLCSHSMYHVQKLCQHAAWIEAGRIRRYGAAADVTREYLAWHEERNAKARQLNPAAATELAGIYHVRSMQLNGMATDEPVVVPEGGTLTVSGTLHSPDGRTPQVAVGVVRVDGTPVAGCYSEMDRHALRPLGNQLYGYEIDLIDLPLLPGRYIARSHAMDPEGMRLFDHVERRFDVAGHSRESGIVKLAHRWR